jgi:chorismate synthase
MTMSGNTIGVLFKVTTWGESHGPATGAIIDGCPPRIDLFEADIQEELDRRRPGTLPSASTRNETDRVEILSGVFEGKTTGTPISLMIRNCDVKSDAYDGLRDLFRPGHGDITYQAKYGIRDHRGGGRASGRETAGRVAAGAIARKVIAQAGMTVKAWTKELGGIAARPLSLAAAEKSPLRCPDPEAEKSMVARLEEARAAGDTIGGIVEIVVKGCPPGLGEPVFGKIDADRRRLQRPHRSGEFPDQPRRGDPGGDHKRRRDRHPGGVQADPFDRSPPGDHRRAGPSRRRHGGRQARCVGHPANHPGLRSDGLDHPCGSSPASEGD